MDNLLFAHLRFDFDSKEIYKEISDFIILSKETGPEKKFLEEYNKHNTPVDVTHFDLSQGKIIKGKIPGYSVISLTKSDNQYSEYGYNFLRKDMHTQVWKWAENFKYTKSVIDQLPFDEYFIVKVISLNSGGIGIPHTDSNSPSETSLTLEILNGDTTLDIFHKEKLYKVKGKAYYFDDSVMHGTGMVKSKRVVMRIHGRLKENWKDYIDNSKELIYL